MTNTVERHPFLSEDWIRAANAIRDQYSDAVGEPAVAVAVNFTVTGTETELQAHADTRSGAIHIDLGHLDDASVTLKSDRATLRMLFIEADPKKAIDAFMTGKIVVQGDVTSLLSLQSAGNADSKTMAEVYNQLRLITADE